MICQESGRRKHPVRQMFRGKMTKRICCPEQFVSVCNNNNFRVGQFVEDFTLNPVSVCVCVCLCAQLSESPCIEE